MTSPDTLPDNTAVIVAGGQVVERIDTVSETTLSAPMDLAAEASRRALNDAGVNAEDIDTLAVIRLFSDAATIWASPFGGSSNPPESVARRLGANPRSRIYSNASGTEPLTVMMELLQQIARGEAKVALLCGTEAIANQRAALRQDVVLNWHEEHDAPLEDRHNLERLITDEELASGLGLPAHYYALIENALAARLGHTPDQHQQHMGRLFAPFSAVAARNPYAQFPIEYTAQELATPSDANYAISLPYTKRLVAQDAVNQSAALLLTSAGHARTLGIAPDRWIVVEAFAQAEDQPLTQRRDITTSAAMSAVLDSILTQAGCRGSDFDLIDIYSCFPCAVHCVSEKLALPVDGSIPLTVTGGLPFFGGPGNNYSMHAMAEMVTRLQGTDQRALVTANGGMLSKHAAAVLRAAPCCDKVIDWPEQEVVAQLRDDIDRVPYAASPDEGDVLSYTVIDRRGKPSIGVVLATTAEDERFLASSAEDHIIEDMRARSPIGRQVRVAVDGDQRTFTFE